MLPSPHKNAEAVRAEDKRNAIYSFAIGRIDIVEDMVMAVKAESIPSHATQFCRTLTGILTQVKSGIQQQQSDQSASDEVKKVLDNLEWLCSYGKSSSSYKKTGPGYWPTLRNLAGDREIDAAIDSLRRFSCKSGFKSRKAFLEKMKGSLQDWGHSRYQTDPSALVSDPPSSITRSKIAEEDIREESESLHHALQTYRSCSREGSLGSIISKIRISSCARLPCSSAEFGVLFLRHPHAHDSRWKEARIQVSSGKSNAHPSELPSGGRARAVRFVESAETQSSIPDSPQLAPITCDEFCERVSKRDQAKLSLSAQDGQFVFHQNLDTSRDWLLDHQAISLAELLRAERGHITHKMKAVLAYLLARAVWQFYDSELLAKRLTKNEVYFLFERRGTIQGVYIDEPMIMTRLGENPPDPSQPEEEEGGTHDMPQMLALGIMLLELETNTFIEDYRNDPDLNPSGVLDMDTDYKIAKRLVDDKEQTNILVELPITSPLRKVLPLCVKAGELQNRFDLLSSAQKQKSTPVDISQADRLRATIYNEIVLPLEQSRGQYVDLQNMKVLRKLAYGATPARPNHWQGSVTSTKQNLQTPRLLPTSKTHNLDMSEELRELSRGWFRDFERLKQVLRPRGAERGPGYKEVKIAVLDTGIDAEDYENYDADGVIGGYQDFVDPTNSEARQDGTGHGSIAASLLVKVCPDALLFLARVLETKDAREAEVQNVVKAIAWAVNQDVDIITMAIGFDEHQPEIEKAIRDAKASGILIFSAASNKRNAGDIYCPANMHDCVLGIFATNAGNREARDLNPSMSVNGRPHCFAIFGEHVEWREFKPLVKGASYSTSIAAGLAALILQFTRQRHDGDASIDLGILEEMTCMAEVFRKMSIKDGSCDCIRPWSLLNHTYETTDWDLGKRNAMRKKQRDWIRVTLERTLYDIYRPN